MPSFRFPVSLGVSCCCCRHCFSCSDLIEALCVGSSAVTASSRSDLGTPNGKFNGITLCPIELDVSVGLADKYENFESHLATLDGVD